MREQNTDRQTFITQYRRESYWAIPLLSFGALVMALVPLMMPTTALAALGAALLTALFVIGVASALKVLRSDDAAVLRDAAQRRLGIYALIALGMGLFGLGTDTGAQWILWAAVVLNAAQVNGQRVAQAQALMDADLAEVSLAAS